MIPNELVERLRAAFATPPDDMHRRFADEVLPHLPDSARAASWPPCAVLVALTLLDECAFLAEQWIGLTHAAGIAVAATGDDGLNLPDASKELVLRTAIGRAALAMLAMNRPGNGTVFTVGDGVNTCTVEVTRSGGRNAAASMLELQNEVEAWRTWAAGLRADFVGVTDNAGDPARLHDWTWIDARRPMPTPTDAATLNQRFEALRRAAVQAEARTDDLEIDLANMRAQLDALRELMASIPFGHDTRRVMVLRSTPESDLVDWVDRVHTAVRADLTRATPPAVTTYSCESCGGLHVDRVPSLPCGFCGHTHGTPPGDGG